MSSHQHLKEPPAAAEYARVIDYGCGSGVLALVLAGLMAHEVDEVTDAYAACFDVARFGEREGWVSLAGRRR
jgi:ribosomal protein L11 methylase PrmA